MLLKENIFFIIEQFIEGVISIENMGTFENRSLKRLQRNIRLHLEIHCIDIRRSPHCYQIYAHSLD